MPASEVVSCERGRPGPGCCQSGLSGAHETLSRARGRDTCHGQLQLCSDKPRNRKKGKSLHNNKKINFWKVIIVCQTDLRSWAGLGWAGLGSGTEHVIHQQLGRQELMSEPFINARVDMFSNED